MIILLGLTDFHFCRLLMYNSCVKCLTINVKTLNILIQKKNWILYSNYSTSKIINLNYTAILHYRLTIMIRILVGLLFRCHCFFFLFIDSLKLSININECLLYTSSTIIRIIILMTIFRRLLHLHFY